MTPTSPAHAQLRATILRDVAKCAEIASTDTSEPYVGHALFTLCRRLNNAADSLSRAEGEGEGEREWGHVFQAVPAFPNTCTVCGKRSDMHGAPPPPGMDALERVCVNGHDRCYEGPSVDCPYCELRPASAGEVETKGGGATSSQSRSKDHSDHGPAEYSAAPVEQSAGASSPSPNPTTPTESEGLLPPLAERLAIIAAVRDNGLSPWERRQIEAAAKLAERQRLEIERLNKTLDYTAGRLRVERDEYLVTVRAKEAAESRVREMEKRKDQAYAERNHVVAAMARLFPSGTRRTDITGWSEDWHGCVYIDLPTGQISYHYHDSQAPLFADLPPYTKDYDGHDKDTVHKRLAALPATQEGET